MTANFIAENKKAMLSQGNRVARSAHERNWTSPPSIPSLPLPSLHFYPSVLSPPHLFLPLEVGSWDAVVGRRSATSYSTGLGQSTG